MSFVIRVRSSQGMHRLNFASNQATFADLQLKISDHYLIEPANQILSSTPPNDPNFIESSSSTTLLTTLGLTHGCIIYIVLAKNQLQKLKSVDANEKKIDENDDENTNSNNNSILKPLPKKKKIWRAPSKKVEDSGPKHIPFHEWIQTRQKKYSKTPWLIDPPKFDYKSVAYRKNLAFSELPSNAVIKRQEYRHLDLVTFTDVSPYTRFMKEWLAINNQLQQSCFLIGRYDLIPNKLLNKTSMPSISTKAKKKLKFLMCAKIYAIYETPQTKSIRGVKFRTEKDEVLINRIIDACGMERIGWCITTMPRGDKKKYKGDIFMSGDEIFHAARMQDKYKNENTGHSRFVTLVAHIGKEAQAYQISDQGVCMIGNSLIKNDVDPGFMKVCAHPAQVYVPSVINENAEIKPGNTFLPDALLVNVMSGKSEIQEHIFNYVHFPAKGNIDSLRKHLMLHKNEEYHSGLSDFYLLIYLAKIIDLGIAVEIAKHVVNKKRMSDELRNKVTQAFMAAIPGWRS